MKRYMNIIRLSREPLTSDDLTRYSKEGWDLVTVKPDWSRQSRDLNGEISPIPGFETWIFSKKL